MTMVWHCGFKLLVCWHSLLMVSCFHKKIIDMVHSTGILDFLHCLHQIYCPQDNQWQNEYIDIQMYIYTISKLFCIDKGKFTWFWNKGEMNRKYLASFCKDLLWKYISLKLSTLHSFFCYILSSVKIGQHLK